MTFEVSKYDCPTWMLAFSDYEEFRPISDLYRELLSSGVQFPDIKENDVDLLKRTLQLSRTSKVSGLVQVPTASNARTAQLMKAIRRDLDQAALDLPAFEAQVQDLARTQPDDVTLRQLHATADRLDGLQGRLKSYVGPLSDSMDPKLGSTEEKETALDELMRVNEKINVNIQQFQSFERIRRGQEEVFTLFIVA
ncbi:unnamed protein product [Dibothriocephalus latus]|uniref:VHS domain-containing protein n=1 Tax=Dibothriocephalus latus TaxID=60516 RepID=A0A3P7NIS4_DIBLA|nr:unnamed protein product [Dibothriocephalus latus]